MDSKEFHIFMKNTELALILSFFIIKNTQEKRHSRPGHDWDPAADSESHKVVSQVHSLSTTWKSIPKCFTICGIFAGLQFKRNTGRRNIAINDIKCIRLRNVTKKGNKWHNKNTWYPPNLLALQKKRFLFMKTSSSNTGGSHAGASEVQCGSKIRPLLCHFIGSWISISLPLSSLWYLLCKPGAVKGQGGNVCTFIVLLINMHKKNVIFNCFKNFMLVSIFPNYLMPLKYNLWNQWGYLILHTELLLEDFNDPEILKTFIS